MFEINRQQLQQRTASYITGLEAAFSANLPPQNIRDLNTNFYERHIDMQRVFLGIHKPVATMLTDVFTAYSHAGVDYIPFLPLTNLPDINILYYPSRGNLWNTIATQKVLTDFPVPGDFRTPAIASRDPDNLGFGNYLNFISSDFGNYGGQKILFGILTGIPIEDARIFDDLRIKFPEAALDLWKQALDARLEMPYQAPVSIVDVVKDDALRMKYFEYVQTLRPSGENPNAQRIDHFTAVARSANVPGFRYITFEPQDSDYEIQVRQAYEDSGMQTELAKLLKPL